MDTLEQIKARILQAIPEARIDVITNPAPAAQHSLCVGRELAREVALFLRDAPGLQLDFCSNVTGVDWLDQSVKEKVKVPQDGGGEKEVEQVRHVPGYLEVVYHLYSMALKHGPVVLRIRTGDRARDVAMPSLTPVWRSCEFQEREVYDLFGVQFQGHPDLRRLLMWEGFKDHPMRKDYVEPDDYEYEPTPHDHVLDRVTAREKGTGVGSKP